MNAPFNIPALIQSMEALLRDHPELADDETLRADMIEGCTDALEAMSVLANWDDETDATIEVLKARESLLKTRRQRMERRKEVIRATMLKVAEAANLKKFALPECTVSLTTGQPRVEVVDPDDLPAEFLRVTVEADKTKLKEALKAGRTVLGAVLTNGTPTITVRRS